MLATILIFGLFQLGAEGRSPNFSIFSVVRFENYRCQSVSDDNIQGICLTNDECASSEGTVNGNCASGFGVCCILYVRNCNADTTITKNGSYVVNPEYPSSSNFKSRTCTYTVNSASFSDPICQLRLDFDTLSISTPTSTGSCSAADTFSATSPSGSSPPSYCGNIGGSHMYVETAREEIAATIKFTLSSNTFNRLWRVKVSYIGCFSPMRAPTDCQQYFTGLAGTFQSYGWANSQVLTANQEFTTCFRQEEGFCAIDFSVPNDGTSPDYFSLSGIQSSNAKRKANSCNNFAVQFTPSVDSERSGTTSNLFCGGQFASLMGYSDAAFIRSDAIPFNVRLVIISTATFSGSHNIGYSIDYRQVPCGNY